MTIWRGAALPAIDADFENAAQALGCDVPAIRAVWEVEAAAKAFRDDGSLTRRFEPHKMPGSPLNWRDSLNMPEKERWALFDQGIIKNKSATLRATSWGGPQIMGENFRMAGFASVEDMVIAMANSGSAQVHAFVSFIQSAGLDTHLRAHDWYKFAVGYNGPGKPDAYAKDMEAAYRRHSGMASPVILRFGAQGAAVKKLQGWLGIQQDGIFGSDTEAKVRAFQKRYNLVEDGVVGFKTWEALELHRANPFIPDPPPAQPTRTDDKIATISKLSGAVTAATAAAAGARELFADHVWQVFGYALAAGVVIFIAAAAVKWVRK